MSVHPHPIVVGVDGSAAGDAALRLAAREARVRSVPLSLVYAWLPFPLYDTGLWPPVRVLSTVDDLEDAQRDVLDRVETSLRAFAPGLPYTSQLVREQPTNALLDASRDAALLVVGGRAPGSHPAWLGPLVSHLAARAQCPLVVVPGVARSDQGGVVVGVDGSELSGEATEFAFEQAERWETDLTAVLSVPNPGPVDSPRFEEHYEQERCSLSRALAGMGERFPDVKVTELVTVDKPLEALLAASVGARLVVVGSHGRGVILRTALGSVSAALLRSASCAVAVVRPSGH